MPHHSRDLHLHQQLLLLALRDEEGTVESRAGQYQLAMAGALLAELALEGRIEISDDKKQLVDLVDDRPLGDELLDECLGLIASAKRRRRASGWISKFAGLKLRHRSAASLCRMGVLRDEEDQVLLIFKRRVYPTIDPGPERELVAQLRNAIFGASRSLDPGLSVVVALAHTTGLLRVHFERRRLKDSKRRLQQIAEGELAAAATKEAVAAVQAAQAAMIATLAATSAATSSATS